LIAGEEYESEVRPFSDDLHDTPIGRLLGRLEVATEAEICGRGFELVGDVTATVRLTFGMVLSAAVLPQWLMPASRGSSREQLIEQMVSFLLHGIAYRP
jgi:hypothetical protein